MAIQQLIDFFSLQSGFLALIISIIVGAICGVLGCFIVLRNMSLIGDALSHAILPGIVISFLIFGYSTFAFFGGSVIAGLISALLITWLQQKVKLKNDAAIGIIFTFMFSLGVIGISRLSKTQGVHIDLKDFLFGNILSVSSEDLWLTLLMGVIVISIIILFYRPLFVTTFQVDLAETLGVNPKMIHYLLMLLLSLCVVASLRSVGVILVVSMLIAPAASALMISNHLPRVIGSAAIIGMISAVTGLCLSILLDSPPGPSMAVVGTLIYISLVFFSPSKGILPKYYRKEEMNKQIIVEDIIKYIYKHQTDSKLEFSEMSKKIGHPENKIKKTLKILKTIGFIEQTGDQIQITEKGKQKTNQLIRAHRLWESFLVEEFGLDPDQVHEEAEQFEHHLSDDFLTEVEERLGFPEIDPHGSPIPKKP
ncbi:MAG: iron chelate uptake ABC transporter family permease subunit [Saprospiraceae bacterium]|nr:metal ABC transporter permease [Saprospiraceae bacterium]